MTRKQVRQGIAVYIKAHPELTYRELAETLNCGLSAIAAIAHEFGITRQRKPLSEADLRKLEG
jgi:hypothetical protein